MFSLFPPVFVSDKPNHSANGQSNNFRIRMFGNANSTAAVLAQEMREFGTKWFYFQGPGLLFLAVALMTSEVLAMIAVVVMVASMIITKFPGVNRWLEYRGHETEVQAAVLLYGADETSYRFKEAVSMYRGYGGLFRNKSLEEIQAGMASKRTGALKYLRRHLKILNRFKAQYR